MLNVFGRPGNDLLSRVLRHSTIGAGEFNGRVRDGIGFGLPAKATGPAKNIRMILVFFVRITGKHILVFLFLLCDGY